MSLSSPSRTVRTDRPARAAALSGVALLAAVLLLGCSSGGGSPQTPPQQVTATDTWVTATAVLLDVGTPGGPEFFDCDTLLGIDPGVVWTVEAHAATAGVTGSQGTPQPNIFIAGTDEDGLTAIGLAMRLDAPTSTAMLIPGRSFFSTDVTCPAVNGVQTSHFEGVDFGGTFSVDITAMDSTGTEVVVAQPVGNLGLFSPEGILEGTFSFEGTNRQDTPIGVLTARLLVSGCFRVNLPEIEQGVPVLRTPCP